MSLYKRGDVWWYRFKFVGQDIRESSKSKSKEVARAAQNVRRRELEEGYNGISKKKRVQVFSVLAEKWITARSVDLSPRSVRIERTNLDHLTPFFGKRLLCDIEADLVAEYQAKRKADGAAPKTVDLEVGTLRAILIYNRNWDHLRKRIKMMTKPYGNIVGRAITAEEEAALLPACRRSRSRSLHPAVVLALNTCMRLSEIRLLRWHQVDLAKGKLTVGRSKTDAGTGREIPLNGRAMPVLQFWADTFRTRKPDHFVFPAEKYGAKGDKWEPHAYATDPTQPILSWKVGWEAAKERAGVSCRFHDLRHTGCTRMLEAGVPFAVVSEIMGWSPSTTALMVKRYGHIGNKAKWEAVQALEAESKTENAEAGAQKGAQSEGGQGTRVN